MSITMTIMAGSSVSSYQKTIDTPNTDRKNTQMNYQETLNRIKAADKTILDQCKVNWNNVAKPLYSLGELEVLTAKIGAALGTSHPDISKRRAIVFCADNGVVEEGVSQTDHTVTTAVARALITGTSNINIFARIAGADTDIYDVGMVDDVPDMQTHKMIHGTANLSRMPAMTKEETIYAIEAGIAAAEKAKADGCGILVVGEMGIGNTTSSTAVLSVLLDRKVEDICGRGSGLSDEGLKKKIAAIKRGIEVNQPDPEDAFDVLMKVGGADIAAMCGVMLAGAALNIPVILDGLISGAAALIAYGLDPRTLDYMIPSHVSHEPGGSLVLDHLKLSPPIHAGMALGEGTGAVMLLPMLDMALALYEGDHSFDDIGIEAYK